MDSCPTCKRVFADFADYPVINIEDVLFLDPQTVPGSIPSVMSEDLIEKKRRGWNNELVPKDVLKHFREHPWEKEHMHEDGYIYYRPTGYKVDGSPHFWKKKRNYSPVVKSWLNDSVSFREYANSLRSVVSKDVEPNHIYPSVWESQTSGVYTIPDSSEMLYIMLEEGKSVNDFGRRIDITVYASGLNLGSAGGPTLQPVLTVGRILYRGKFPDKV